MIKLDTFYSASFMRFPRIWNLIIYSKQNGILKMSFDVLTTKRVSNGISAT